MFEKRSWGCGGLPWAPPGCRRQPAGHRPEATCRVRYVWQFPPVRRRTGTRHEPDAETARRVQAEEDRRAFWSHRTIRCQCPGRRDPRHSVQRPPGRPVQPRLGWPGVRDLQDRREDAGQAVDKSAASPRAAKSRLDRIPAKWVSESAETRHDDRRAPGVAPDRRVVLRSNHDSPHDSPVSRRPRG